jgi:iron complex outermembrane receptor protein
MAAACATALAQTNATRALPRALVEGLSEPSLTVPSIGAVRADLASVPGGTSVVLGEDIRRGRASTLRDALDFTPGVFVQSRFGAEEARISIRGSGLQRTFHGRGLKLLQDGVPLNLADGGFDMQAVEPLAARHVEVWRGANALRYGATTLGGAINFVTPTGHDADPLQGRVEAGSFGYVRSQVGSGAVVGDADYYASFTHFAQDGYRQHAAQETQRFFAGVGYRISGRLENRAWFTAVKTDSQLPGSLSLSNALHNPRLGSFAGDQKRDFTLYRLSDRLAWVGDNSEVQVSGFWSHKDLDHPIFQVVDQNSNDLGLDARFTHRGRIAGMDNRFMAGFAPVYGWVEEARFVNGAFAGRPRRGAKTAENRLDSLNLDTYFEDTLRVSDRIRVVGGASVSHARRQFKDRFLSDGDQTDTRDYLGFNPKLGVIHEFAKGAQAFANVSRSFEPPSFGELTRPAIPGQTNGLVKLEAQTGTTLEAGTRGDLGRFTWDISIYHAWLDDELLSLQVGNFNPPVTQTVNAGRTIHQGFELGLGGRLVEGAFFRSADARGRDDVFVQLTYLFSDFRFDGDPRNGDNRLPGIPRHHLRAEVRYEHGCGFYLGPNVEWVPEAYPVDIANTRSTYAPGYAILGMRAGYRATKGINFFVDARNLTDEAYVATTGVLNTATVASAAFNPGDGRAFYGGLEIRF